MYNIERCDNHIDQAATRGYLEEDTKCSHDLCVRERVNGSKFCGKCIQLNTKEYKFL